MARSVVLAGAKRCEGCRLPPRWCLCGALAQVDTAVAVDILIHRREQWRPSSTGALLARSIRGARLHVHRPDPRCREAPMLPAALLRPDHVCWVLHPQGDSITDECPPAPSAQPRQVVLLDGNWREAGEMLRLINAAAGAAGREGSAALRVVRLPEGAPGRFWIREAPAPGQRATAEACGTILGLLGESAAAERLRLHFELHVWATLRARGKVDRARAYLAESPLLAAAPALLAALATRRPE